MPTMSSNRWAQVNLDPQIEHDAALVTVEFLKKIRDALKNENFTQERSALTIPAFSPEKHLPQNF